MNEIKEYKQLTTIELFEGEIMTEATMDQLEEMINSPSKFLRIGDEMIAKNQIKRVFIRKIESIENFILSQPKDIQEKLKAREKEKYQRVGRKFDSIQEIQNFITNNITNVSV